MVEGAVAALIFVAVTFALLFTLAFILVLTLVVPRAHAPTTTTERANTKSRTGGRTSVFFILAFSEGFALAARRLNSGGLEGKVDRIVQRQGDYKRIGPCRL